MMKGQSKKWLVLGLVAVGAVGALVVGCQGEEEAAQPPASEADRRIQAISAELELDEAQQQRLTNVRDLVHERRDAMHADREEQMEAHLAAVEAGELDAAEVHGHIDEKVDEVRATIHQVADEIMALVESMDQEQRTRAVAKLRTFHERMETMRAHMESEEGHQFMSHFRERMCEGHPDIFGMPPE